VGDVTKSSLYCRETLQRQLAAGLGDPKAAFEWAKNCASIADFYQAMGQLRHCAAALASAEKVLRQVLHAPQAGDAGDSGDAGGKRAAPQVSEVDAVELDADISRRWARLDAKVLKQASDSEAQRRVATEEGIPWADGEPVDDASDAQMGAVVDVAPATGDTPAQVRLPTCGPMRALFCAHAQRASQLAPPMQCTFPQVSLFAGLAVDDTPLLRPADVRNFDSARRVRLACR